MPTPVRTIIVYVLDGGPADGSLSAPVGTNVMLQDATTKLAENVVYGDVVCVNGIKGTVVEVRQTIYYDDDSVATTVINP